MLTAFFNGTIICFLLTVVIEPLFFACFGFHTRKFVLFSVLINIVTNIIVNVVMYFLIKNGSTDIDLIFGILEASVIIIEGTIYFFVFKKDILLIPLTIAANSLTVILGILVGVSELI